MSTAVEPKPAPSRGGTRDLEHIACCQDLDIALCGTRAPGQTWSRRVQVDCIVCTDLAAGSCHAVCPKRKQEQR